VAVSGPAAVDVGADFEEDILTFLEKADELFLLEQYPQAIAQYEAFLAENPEGPARARLTGDLLASRASPAERYPSCPPALYPLQEALGGGGSPPSLLRPGHPSFQSPYAWREKSFRG